MRLVRWSAAARPWSRRAAAAALGAGGVVGAVAALHLPAPERGYWAGRVLAFAAWRTEGRGHVLRPALDGWLRAAAPVWAAGLWPGPGAVVVLLALALHAFALAFGLAVAAARGPGGLEAAVLAVLPGNVAALPALWWLASRALDRALAPPPARRLGPYLGVGGVVLVAVACSSLGEAALGPVLLHLV